jgi:peptidoglycan L-alanyl-D-glutamate endopeptidase CwlK
MDNFIWSKRSLENLEGIHLDLRKVCDLALKLSPVDFTIIDGLRTIEEERGFVAAGTSQTMNSRHLTGHAIDFAPWVDGKLRTDDGSVEHFAVVAGAFKDAALKFDIPIIWGGNWKTLKDYGHIELSRAIYA